MPSVFTRIISKELPAYILFEDDTCMAFLDINPIQKGHTLLIPKEEIDDFFDLSPQRLAELMITARCLARALKKVMNCKRVAVNIHGFDVPHAHIHLIPANSQEDLSTFKSTLTPTPQELESIADKIRKCLEA